MESTDIDGGSGKGFEFSGTALAANLLGDRNQGGLGGAVLVCGVEGLSAARRIRLCLQGALSVLPTKHAVFHASGRGRRSVGPLSIKTTDGLFGAALAESGIRSGLQKGVDRRSGIHRFPFEGAGRAKRLTRRKTESVLGSRDQRAIRILPLAVLAADDSLGATFSAAHLRGTVCRDLTSTRKLIRSVPRKRASAAGDLTGARPGRVQTDCSLEVCRWLERIDEFSVQALDFQFISGI